MIDSIRIENLRSLKDTGFIKLKNSIYYWVVIVLGKVPS